MIWRGGQKGDDAVDLLIVVGGLFTLLIGVGWSCARSYYEKGRLLGMKEAAREIIRGIDSHCDLEGKGVPDSVLKAVAALQTISRRNLTPTTNDPYEARFWVFGDAVGDACWRKGHASGLKKREPAVGKLRIDLSANELLHLSWLAHLGFLHMMPNFRGFEIHRFSGAEDAEEGSKAIGRLEAVIPSAQRPFDDPTTQLDSRQKLIRGWWDVVPKRLVG
jgi:hypothetical protein